jgi:hypothetical protein
MVLVGALRARCFYRGDVEGWAQVDVNILLDSTDLGNQ